MYVGETIFVDLYSSKSSRFNADTPIFLWSSGKSVGNILMGIQRDRGLIQFDKEIAHYWPEFAQNGKENIKIEDVCRHESGLWKLHKKIKPENLQTDGILRNETG